MFALQNLVELNSIRKILDNQNNTAYADLNPDATRYRLTAKNSICTATSIFRPTFIKMFWKKQPSLSL